MMAGQHRDDGLFFPRNRHLHICGSRSKTHPLSTPKCREWRGSAQSGPIYSSPNRKVQTMENSITTATAESDPEIEIEFPNMIRVYKDGSIERLDDPGYIPPSPDDPFVATRDVVIDPVTGVKARLFLPVTTATTASNKKLPILVYFHGGGFCICSAFSPLYHHHLHSLSSQASLLVVSVEYRLAPENPLPAAYDDCYAALRWVHDATDEWISARGDVSRVFLSGDSAGGNIVHNVAMRAGEEGGPVEGLVLVHPYFWGTKRMESEKEEPEVVEDGPVLFGPEKVDQVWPFVCGGKTTGNDDPRVNPLVEGAPPLERLGCERVMVCVAGKDLVRDRGRAFFEALRRSGKWGGDELEILESEGQIHVFHLFWPESDPALEFMDRVVAFYNRG